MGRLPRELEAKRQRLVRAAQRGAFDSYVRHGRVPETYARIAELVREAKALGDSAALPTPAVSKLPSGRPTNHYTWRTAGDHKVRTAHAALNGRVFSWANPPDHGHPGSEPNCRCWPEPYYGDPAVPDAMLRLMPERRVNTNPAVLWASIETLKRPDGSPAASSVVMSDGTVIDSTFVGSTVAHAVTLPDASSVQVQKEGEARRVSPSRLTVSRFRLLGSREYSLLRQCRRPPWRLVRSTSHQQVMSILSYGCIRRSSCFTPHGPFSMLFGRSPQASARVRRMLRFWSTAFGKARRVLRRFW